MDRLFNSLLDHNAPGINRLRRTLRISVFRHQLHVPAERQLARSISFSWSRFILFQEGSLSCNVANVFLHDFRPCRQQTLIAPFASSYNRRDLNILALKELGIVSQSRHDRDSSPRRSARSPVGTEATKRRHPPDQAACKGK